MDELKAEYHYEIARSSNVFHNENGELVKGYMKMEVGVKSGFTDEENELMHKEVARVMVAQQLRIDKQLVFPISEELYNKLKQNYKFEERKEFSSLEEFEKEVRGTNEE
ncbi:hypothetical protein M3_0118 [Lysinibacillus phage vB_LfM_LysYB1]|nr:hypothetical protein M3_0118 [Lysinibacillus phage vB_LfM_LysYB1]WAB25372.1 hypothetical protein M5_0194 [Lysinibacillus phage vB_LfM_LysYB2]